MVTSSPTEPVLCNADIAELREKLGCSLLELTYLLGRTTILLPMKKEDKARRPLKNMPLSYLIRLVREEPDAALAVLPQWPTFADARNAVASVWDKQTYGRFSDRKFAIICGVTPWTFAKWSSGENTPTTSTVRLFCFLCDIIKRKGREGLEIYLDCIDRDAKSRGKSGLKELFKSPVKKADREQVAEEQTSEEQLPEEPVQEAQ